jgi:aspartate racemase
MAALDHRLINKGAQAVVAGCTEVPLVLSQTELSTLFLDATQTLAARCVEACLAD